MPAPQTERLRGIKTLPQLLAYLRDELDWPIESDDTENVTFDYEASELGLDEKSAVRIKEIKQLRPLSGNQPWGIFFVNFEKKALPVMVMRRILRSLVFKKRTTAGRSERQAWHASDLLFVSAYGEESDRAITFAHFVEDEDLGGLAELRVLGWDDDDTPLKYDYVAHTLHEKLRWRDEYERKPDEWSAHWRSAFELRHREVITTSKQLASQLANLAKKIRARVRSVLRYEDGFGQIRKLQAAFRKALIHDLSDDDFADMYAQTITYGLFSAAVSRPAGIHGENIVDMVPVTNPFLRDMLQTFLNLSGRKGRIDFDELGIQEVVALLNSPSTHLDAVLRDFGNRTQREDPVIHFYEDFLREYDARKKIQRGVFYTPQPVVSYIVRSVHELLQTEFGLEDGLADTTTWREMAKNHADLKIPEGVKPEQPFVQILDPATGTATFLVEVIDVIYRHLKAKWDKGGLKAMPLLPTTSFPRLASAFAEYWNQYVALALLPRLHGYELMMAPYAIAHMKLGLKLFETGYRFGSDERARIYLTNALEPPSDIQRDLPSLSPALAHEAAAVNEIKRHKRFTVVIGNPPYSGNSANTGEWISRLVQDYYQVDGAALGERNPKWLQDDYVKFVRAGQFICSQSPMAVFGFITNHGYIDNPTFRGMRQSLLADFRELWVLDLHGNVKKKETTADGGIDENVFDIQQGVAIFLASRGPKTALGLKQSDVFGTRSEKYSKLASDTAKTIAWRAVAPVSPFYVFLPQDEAARTEYLRYPSIKQAMPVNVLGFQTHRDDFAVAFDRDMILERCEALRDSHLKDAEIKTRFEVSDNRDWNVREARKEIRDDPRWKRHVIRCLYRPFDIRWCYFSTVAMDYPRRELIDHVAEKENLCLLVPRQISFLPWQHTGVADTVAESCLVSTKTKEQNYNFPLYLYPESDGLDLSSGKRSNFSEPFLRELAALINSPQTKPHGLPAGLAPEDIFRYAYAVFHSPGYRSRYAEFLKIDFPRLPLTGNLELFRALARLGGELVALHLLESPKLDKPRTEFIGGRNPEVEKISYVAHASSLRRSARSKLEACSTLGTVWIDKAQTTGFKGVPEAVWNFHIGGYQVCHKWLKDRKGRTLSRDDIAHYHKIVIALAETIRLMAEIDQVIEKHGGWPGAFRAKVSKNSPA